MSAWDKLLAASSLAIGTAWQLISSPKTVGTGTGATIYIESVKINLADPTVNFDIPTQVTNFEVDTAVVSFTAVAEDATDTQDNTTEVRVV